MRGAWWPLAVAFAATTGYAGIAVAQTAVPPPPTNSFFAVPTIITPSPTSQHKCPQATVKGGSIVNAVGILTTTGCNWSGTIHFKPGNATLTFVSTSKISVRQINLGTDDKGHFGGGIISTRPNGDLEFVHARSVVNELSVAFDMSP